MYEAKFFRQEDPLSMILAGCMHPRSYGSFSIAIWEKILIGRVGADKRGAHI